ncbi:kyphoscoliosis peptidase-like isoform X2 [Babylonia areolata]
MARPTLPHGYLGPQAKFQEFGMSTVSHNSPEISTSTSPLEVKIRAAKPIKVTANLVVCGTETEHKEYVFTQTEEEGKGVTLIVVLPSAGYFKLQIFALLGTDDSKSLPNVYNYLINSTIPSSTPVITFPKQFAQWKDGCYLFKPYHLNNLEKAAFEVCIPGAKAVAVTVEKDWFHFTQGPDGAWRGEVGGLARFRGKGLKAILNANFLADKSKYTSLLEYDL